MRVREATAEDLADALNVLDGAALAVDHDRVRNGLSSGDVLVAAADDGGTVLGALVLDGEHVAAVAVRRRRRGQSIGTELVEAAADRRDRLTADFDGDVRPFYEKLGFDVAAADDPGRYRGVYEE